jgi:hypothetical protein
VYVATTTDKDGNVVESFAVSSSLASATREGAHESDKDLVVASEITLEWPADPTDTRENRSRTVVVMINDDAANEAALEALTLTLVNATNADVDSDYKQTVIVVEDDDDLPRVAVRPFHVAYPPVDEISGATLRETNKVSIPVDVTSGSSALAFSVSYVVANGTAVPGVAYTNTSGTLTWSAHDTSTKFIDVDVHWGPNTPRGGHHRRRHARSKRERRAGRRGLDQLEPLDGVDGGASAVRRTPGRVSPGDAAHDQRGMDRVTASPLAASPERADAPLAAAARLA